VPHMGKDIANCIKPIHPILDLSLRLGAHLQKNAQQEILVSEGARWWLKMAAVIVLAAATCWLLYFSHWLQ